MCVGPSAHTPQREAQRHVPGPGSNIPRAGGLRRHLDWWQQNCLSKWTLQWVTAGFPLWWEDPHSPAPAFYQPNHAGAVEHKDFVTKEVADLLTAGAVKCVTQQPHVVSPLNVTPKKNGKLRLILDLRHVNQYLRVPNFKYESLTCLETLAQPGDLMFSTDLAAGYWQVDMHPDSWQYLGFQWEGQWYVFCVLPFGLASAPWCFTKTMREVVGHFRSKGVRVVAYIDDFLFLVPGNNLQLAATIRHLVLNTFTAAGLEINLDKSHLDFTHILQHLGFMIDLRLGVFLVPPDRWSKLQSLLSVALSSRRVSVRTLSQISGHLISMHLAIGHISRLFSRACYFFQSQHSPNYYVTVDERLKTELHFWAQCDRESLTTPIWKNATVAQFSVHTLATDAGGESWGAVYGSQRAHGYFRDTLRTTSSTFREMLAAFYSLQSFSQFLTHRHVHILTDNSAVPNIISHGSRKPHLHDLALDIFWMCRKHKISLTASWIPRDQNQLADAMTRWNDTNDWKLHPAVFQFLDQQWGPHTCDRFASHNNTQIPRFHSFFWCPGTAGVDAFAQPDWSVHNNWCYPPFDLIPRVLGIVTQQQARATLIIPVWPSRPWWPIVSPRAGCFSPLVHSYFELPHLPNLFLPGKQNGNTRGVGNPKWTVLALRIDGRGGGQCTHTYT